MKVRCGTLNAYSITTNADKCYCKAQADDSMKGTGGFVLNNLSLFQNQDIINLCYLLITIINVAVEFFSGYSQVRF